MTLYADILFAINFSMDFLSLFLCSIILHKKTTKLRMLIASVIGAIYGVLDVIFIRKEILSIVICILMSIIICIIAFFEKNLKRMLLSIFVYWGISATLGGLMSLLYSFLNRIFLDFLAEYPVKSVYNGARFFLIVSITAIVSIFFSKIFTNKKDIKATEVTIEYGGEKYKITALCDSGNMLTDPLSGKPVVLVSKKTRLGNKLEKVDDKFKRYIPYNDVSGKGMLKGIVPQKIKVGENLVDAIVAPINKDDFASYEALVPQTLV